MCTFFIACPVILASWYLEFSPDLKNYCCVSKTCINLQRILQRVKWKVTAGQKRVATVSRTSQLLLGWHPCPFPPCHTAGHALLNVQLTSPQSPITPPSHSISHVSCWCLLLDRIYSGEVLQWLESCFLFLICHVGVTLLFVWLNRNLVPSFSSGWHFPLLNFWLKYLLSILNFILKWLFLIYKCCYSMM